MKLTLEHNGTTYECDTSVPLVIGIPLNFDGDQPNHFGAPNATSTTLVMGDFVGDTSRGGGCNVKQIQLVPHCNGTHTETVGHIVDDTILICEAARSSLFAAVLITVEPVHTGQTNETYMPMLDASDSVITSSMLLKAFGALSVSDPVALIIRTVPNSSNKSRRQYSAEAQPPFLTVEAIQAINDMGVKHLLLDVPSIDRMFDNGLLTCHHLFWNVPHGTHRLTKDSQIDKTVTEMVFVPDEIKDGFYLLNLQIAAFSSDAAPSRPILFSATEKLQNHE